MFYNILNNILERKITTLHPIAMKLLSNDLEGDSGDISAERLDVFRKYVLLFKHFNNDPKRKYMINSNYFNFLKAIIYLYQTSAPSVGVGIFTAPSKIYGTINSVKESFNELAANEGLE